MSDDPSLVDTATLEASLIRDLGHAQAATREAHRWLQAANVTAWELKRRGEAGRAAPAVFGDPNDPDDLRPLHERVRPPRKPQ